MRRYLASPTQLQLYFQQRHHALLPEPCPAQFIFQLLSGEKRILPQPSSMPGEKQIVAMWSGSKKLLIKTIKTVPELLISLPDELEKLRIADLCRAVFVLKPHLFAVASHTCNVGGKQRKRTKMYSIRKEFANMLLLLSAAYSGEVDFLGADSNTKVTNSQ